MPVTRRRFLQGMSMAGAAVRVGLPPLAAWFTSNGTAYAAAAGAKTITPRFVFWFNGNGIPERYWIPSRIGTDYELTPCLAPLESLRNDIHVISSIDNAGARSSGPGNGHHKSISGVLSGAAYTGRGAGGASIDQVIAGRHGRADSIQLAAGWRLSGIARREHPSQHELVCRRALPPEMIPQNLFDRMFGVRGTRAGSNARRVCSNRGPRRSWRSAADASASRDRHRLDEHLTSVRDLEIANRRQVLSSRSRSDWPSVGCRSADPRGPRRAHSSCARSSSRPAPRKYGRTGFAESFPAAGRGRDQTSSCCDGCSRRATPDRRQPAASGIGSRPTLPAAMT